MDTHTHTSTTGAPGNLKAEEPAAEPDLNAEANDDGRKPWKYEASDELVKKLTARAATLKQEILGNISKSRDRRNNQA